MKDQRTKSEKRPILRVLTAILLMLTLTVIGLTVSVAADAQTTLTVKESNLSFADSGLVKEGDAYTKTYDGKDVVALSIANTDGIGFAAGDDVTLAVASAKFNDANVASAYEIIVKFTLSGKDAYKYALPADLRLSAKILPATVEWNGEASATITYDPTVKSYTIAPSLLGDTVPALKPITGLETEIAALAPSVTFVNALNAVSASATPYDTQASVDLGNANFKAAPLPVKVTVNPIEITDIVWTGETTLTYGDKINVTATATVGNLSYNVLKVVCTDEGFAAGNAGSYTLVAELIDTVNYKFKEGSDGPAKNKALTILPKKYTVSMSDITVIGDGKTAYRITVDGDLPEAVKKLITYTVNGEAFNGTTAFGAMTVKATLPSGNYSFDTEDSTGVTELEATLTVNRQEKLIPVVDESGNTVGSIILVNREGFSDSITATAVAVEAYPSITRATRLSQAFKIVLVGAEEGQTFSILIPLETELYHLRADDLTLDTLCVYESATKSLRPASQAGKGFSVVLGDGYYLLSGLNNGGEITFVIAPDYHTPFFETAIGIVLIVLLVLAFFVMLFYIGMILRRALDTRENPVLVMDTEGVLPEEQPVETEEPDADEFIEEKVDEIAEELEAEEEEVVVEEEVVEEEDTTVADELAESVAEELAETVEAEDEQPVEEAEVEEAATEAMDAALNESADAEDAVEIDEDEDDDAVETLAVVDEDEDDDSFSFAVGADPSTFIDVKEYPEIYQEYLEREARGEIHVVSRYKKSFTSKLAQSLGNVQDYYSAIKNALLSFKGVKGRVSWNYEAFNKGRVHVAKIDAKSKSLYLYLAIDPAVLEGTKYGFVDVSSKKKYATTPCLMKIRGDRKFKHALELIEMLCGSQMELVKLETEEVDYRVPRYTMDEMIEQGILKHYAGYIVLDPTTEPTEEEIPAEATEEVVEEAAVAEVATEETVAETADETVAEEAPVEEEAIPADADATEAPTEE